jgi:alpha-galactosidase/6-phospho-beta-glucosidase family protein
LDPIPAHHKGLCHSTAYHQRLLVDASVAGDKEMLLRALPMFEELWSAAVDAGELGT